MFGFSQEVTDPVCKMKVDQNKTKFSSEYQGQKYSFCSEDCRKEFAAGAEKYAVQKEGSQAQNCC